MLEDEDERAANNEDALKPFDDEVSCRPRSVNRNGSSKYYCSVSTGYWHIASHRSTKRTYTYPISRHGAYEPGTPIQKRKFSVPPAAGQSN